VLDWDSGSESLGSGLSVRKEVERLVVLDRMREMITEGHDDIEETCLERKEGDEDFDGFQDRVLEFLKGMTMSF
jgi:hypothetical protein